MSQTLCVLTDYPIASDIKPAHRILSLIHTNCRGKPNIRILPPLLQKNKYGHSQLYRDQIFSHTIYLYNRKCDWCLIVHPIWLVWHTYISHPLIHPPITYPTRRLRGIFFTKNNSKTIATTTSTTRSQLATFLVRGQPFDSSNQYQTVNWANIMSWATSSPGVPFIMRWKSGPLARSNDNSVLIDFVNTIDWDQNQSDLSDLTLRMRRVTESP